ncbi:hypothetical protein HMPREF9444_01982 [Succinatimonas hippei YIT 12066]|uniref:Uncharacterized protein n=1 Tax=Succinatimonas hippei (strain DSM 22608 / JCM 16073 / KCTC 15190 / YIT 12066) TaxID=762983 RepID=E8LMJ2_SUCHY|nr:hypothetical protein HMPREF9444_01982 [Succinatimonas hippei YIT 12066]
MWLSFIKKDQRLKSRPSGHKYSREEKLFFNPAFSAGQCIAAG